MVIGGVPVVAAPEEIDTLDAEYFQELLQRAASGEHPALVVNMTTTRFCDSVAVSALALAHERARAQ